MSGHGRTNRRGHGGVTTQDARRVRPAPTAAIKIAAVSAVSVAVLGCGVPASAPAATPGSRGSSGPSGPPGSAGPGGPADPPSASPGSAAGSGGAGTSAGAAGGTVIEIRVTGRRVSPAGRRFTVRRGGLVQVTVTGDRADELHVHGYDRTAAVVPGRPSTVRFVANLPGVFEAELHESGLRLFELQVG